VVYSEVLLWNILKPLVIKNFYNSCTMLLTEDRTEALLCVVPIITTPLQSSSSTILFIIILYYQQPAIIQQEE